MFSISYLKIDLQEKILSEKDVVFLENAIANQIFYNSNLIFNEILNDIKLIETVAVKKVILIILDFFKLTFVLIKIKKWVS